MSDKAHVCGHGQLSRSCNICDLLGEIDELRAKLAKSKQIGELLKCLESVLSEEGVRETFLSYVQGARMLYLLEKYRGEK